MRAYTFFKHDGARDIPGFELAEFADDEAARRHALAILAAEPRYSAVEVWSGDEERFRIDRSAPASRPPPRRLAPEGSGA
jgi:hypothetical protein